MICPIHVGAVCDHTSHDGHILDRQRDLEETKLIVAVLRIDGPPRPKPLINDIDIPLVRGHSYIIGEELVTVHRRVVVHHRRLVRRLDKVWQLAKSLTLSGLRRDALNTPDELAWSLH